MSASFAAATGRLCLLYQAQLEEKKRLESVLSVLTHYGGVLSVLTHLKKCVEVC